MQEIIPKGQLTPPHSSVIHVGHGLMLHASLAEGCCSLSHPGLKRSFGNLQSTVLSLVPSPQETEHYKKETTRSTCADERTLYSPGGVLLGCFTGAIRRMQIWRPI